MTAISAEELAAEADGIAGLVSSLDYGGKIAKFDSIAAELSSLSEKAYRKSKGYGVTLRVTEACTVTFDAVLAAIAVCYFIYTLCSGVSAYRSEYYGEILKLLNE